MCRSGQSHVGLRPAFRITKIVRYTLNTLHHVYDRLCDPAGGDKTGDIGTTRARYV